MPGFDVVKFVGHVVLIAILTGVLMWGSDQIRPMFEALVSTGLISQTAIDVDTVCSYYAVMAFGPVAFIFACIGAVLVANARAEVNSPLIQTSMLGTITCFVSILTGILVNVCVSMFCDTWVNALSLPISGPLDVTNTMGSIFSFAHYCGIIIILLGYLYMVYTSLKIESLEWSI